MTNPQELEQKVDRCAHGLRTAGVKLTHQRMEICRELMSRSDHPDVEAIFGAVRQRVPTISIDTVYRTLWTLLELGMIATLSLPRERVRFDTNTARHHHFVCALCGDTRDFYSRDFDELEPPEEVKAYGTARDVHIEVRGICHRCNELAQQ